MQRVCSKTVGLADRVRDKHKFSFCSLDLFRQEGRRAGVKKLQLSETPEQPTFSL
jgi:hypothetical protein